MDPPGVREAHVMGTNEFQTREVPILGSEEREGHRQVLLQAGREPDPICH